MLKIVSVVSFPELFKAAVQKRTIEYKKRFIGVRG
jgi:hypothetical protein